MEEPLTEELLEELLAAPSIEQLASSKALINRNLPTYLNELLEEKHLDRPAVVRMAGINPTFGYQIFVGQRHPSRDYVLALAFAMGLTIQETNRLLQVAKVNELYCKDRRDAIILFCLSKAYSLQKVDEELYRFGETTIR